MFQSLISFLISQAEGGTSVEPEVAPVVNATTAKTPATPEGKMVAYVSLVIMALVPIFIGSYKSVKHHKNQQEHCKASGEKPETMTTKDAAMFPFIASGALLGLYIFFKVFSKEYVNLLLTGYFFVLGVLALTHVMAPILDRWLPATVPRVPYHLKFTRGEDDSMEALIDFGFSTCDLIGLVLSSILGAWYLWKKHWIANNLFGIAFSVNGVELLHLNSIATGCILLCGLFVYDVFWVFGTDVMVTVAKSFEAPIKVIFPQDFLENGVFGTNFAMLGLGDIVIPGIFIALLLRFDRSLNRTTDVYFLTSFIAYIIGLVTTIVVLTIFNHAQPALLYLVPACVGLPLLLALVRGDIKTMFLYEDHPQTESEIDAKKKE